MEEDMLESVIHEVQPQLDSNPHLLSNARVLMTSVPNTGCFLAIPRSSIQLQAEYFAESLGWEYCFEKATQQGNLVYFKNELT